MTPLRRFGIGAVVAATVLGLFVLVALLGPVLLPYDSVATRVRDRLLAPGATTSDGAFALLGTDQNGRDVLAQVIAGSRVSLLVGVTVVVVGVLVGQLPHVVRNGFCWDTRSTDSPYAQFAVALSFAWIAPLINIDALLSPMGSGLVYTHALTREVAALSRAHLTHRGLQTAKQASIRVGGQEIDVYWAVLLVDFVVGWLALVAVGGNWGMLAPATSILNMLLYAMPGVVLVAIHNRLPARWQGRRRWHSVLARLGFVSIALLLYWASWPSLWQSMAALIIGVVVLLGLPILARQDLPVLGRALRRYDAKEYATLFRRYRANPAAGAAITLVAYLAVLTALGWSRNVFDPNPQLVREIPLNILVVGTSLGAFQFLVAFSRRHMTQFPPILPTVPDQSVAATTGTG